MSSVKHEVAAVASVDLSNNRLYPYLLTDIKHGKHNLTGYRP